MLKSKQCSGRDKNFDSRDNNINRREDCECFMRIFWDSNDFFFRVQFQKVSLSCRCLYSRDEGVAPEKASVSAS